MKKRIVSVRFGDPCPHCGSTRRTAYGGTKKRPIAGKPGFFIVSRYTTCKRCGERRKETRAES